MISDYDLVMWWLANHQDRKIELSHGGEGGRFYARLIDEDGESPNDGAGDTVERAIGDCCDRISIDELMQESGGWPKGFKP